MRIFAVPVLLAVLVALTAGAGEPEKKKEKEKKAQEKQEEVTNETLKEKYGEPSPVEPSQESSKKEPASEKVQPKSKIEMSEEARGKRIAELEKEQDRIKRRIASLKNPFLPKVPPTEEEKKAEEGKGSDERVRMLEERRALIDEELKKLRKEPDRS